MEIIINKELLELIRKYQISIQDYIVLISFVKTEEELCDYFTSFENNNTEYMLSIQRLERFGYLQQTNKESGLYEATETAFIDFKLNT
jgi:hypothetical protein